MTRSLLKDNTVSQAEGNIVSDMAGEKVMLSIRNGKYYNLGEIGGEIWEQIKEPTSINAVVTQLMYQYDVDENECEQQVTRFLEDLLKEELIKLEEA